MSGFVKFMTILAAGSVIATLVSPKAKTDKVIAANWKGLTGFAKVTQGRG